MIAFKIENRVGRLAILVGIDQQGFGAHGGQFRGAEQLHKVKRQFEKCGGIYATFHFPSQVLSDASE
ncbi:MAG: hypothetical protein QNJ61_02165 [Desulfobacterales bacterium]|nr:hypothetical protein [Desulfobacterales bacterium]